ncbi:hypothetical protein G6O69_25675 [Pseudenhygromyxa sp. WMMC2535]|uniref:PDZ domain-containing protein n=1 Tax=Pseudenhygromyxa sp. WMMC2535 TaxID=2712867 RepID=UPI001554C8D0|nr:PDZ domain-containing protein [Pseudenhygromyxa sp. WMMC2535]NVB41255.1 hypothetical protein [Pseudenhygromyxa sp. WMMC2535]
MGAQSEDCADNLSEPIFLGACRLREAACEAPAGDDEAGEDEGGDDGEGLQELAGVTCNDAVCTVPEALIESLLYASADTLSADGTLLSAHYTSLGSQDGWEVSGVVAGNLGDVLGLQNGDVITEIDGEVVDSLDAALAVGSLVVYAESVDLGIVRSGQLIQRTYERE